MTKAKVSIRLDLDFGRESVAACLDLPRFSEEANAFEEPLHCLSKGTDVALQMVLHHTSGDEQAFILANRKKVAKKLSSEMVTFLLDQMAAKDTMNGYTKGEKDG